MRYTDGYVRADSIFEGDGIYDDFDGVREEAEIQGISNSADCQMFVNEYFEKNYPEFFKWINYNLYDDVLAEYYPFDDGSGYAVYIHLSKRLRDMIEDRFPERFI